MQNKEAKFTICIPTFNRGKRALEQVQFLLDNIQDKYNWKILVLDNGSKLELEYYLEIKELSSQHSRLEYIKHDENRFFNGNYMACITMAKTKYIMIMSDEDIPNIKNLEKLLPEIIDDDIGVVRGSIESLTEDWQGNSMTLTNKYYKAGKEALNNFVFFNNYLSGTIYNRDIIINFNLLQRLKENLSKHAIYPHLYLESLLCAVSNIKLVENVLSYEGKAENTPDETGIVLNDPNAYKLPYSFGARVDLMIVFRDAIYEAIGLIDKKMDMGLFLSLYLKIIHKTFYLISRANAPMYIKNNLNIRYLQESLLHCAFASIVTYKEFKDKHEYIIETLNKIYEEFRY